MDKKIISNSSNLPPNSQPFLADFYWYDYTLFAAVLAVSVSIGIYIGCYGSKQSNKKEYMVARRQMKPLPVAISLISAQITPMHILAIPADVYKYGPGFVWHCLSFFTLIVVFIYIYLPVFFHLQTSTTYEYLEKRFNTRTRVLASFLYNLVYILFLPVNIYGPALALSLATGINIYVIILTVCSVCIFYTTIGGLRTVIWTDVLQFGFIVAAIIAVLVVGTNAAGGFMAVLNIAKNGERFNLLDFNLNPLKRDSFWILLIGGTADLMSYTTVDQTFVQKFMAVASYRDTALCIIYFAIGGAIVNIISVFFGLIIYAKYFGCDPVASNVIAVNDQIVPYFVSDIAHNIPGFYGIFITGLFCASLSSFSAFLNATAVAVHEDFIVKIFGSKDRGSWPLKTITLVIGIICTCLVFAIEHIGDIFPILLIINGLFVGPMLGVFTLGMLFPKANSKGAFYGGILGFFIIASIVLPSKYFELSGESIFPSKPISIDNCTFLNETYKASFRITDERQNSDVFFIFRISIYYYTLIGAICSIISGLLISYCTKNNKKLVDKNLLSPVSQFWISKRKPNFQECQKDNKPEHETFL